MGKKKRSILFAAISAAIMVSLFFPYQENACGATPAEIQEWLDAQNKHRGVHGVPPSYGPIPWPQTPRPGQTPAPMAIPHTS